VGEYETASEVVREALRLLRHRDEVWKMKSPAKSRREWTPSARRTFRRNGAKEMAAFKKKWSKSRAAK